MLIKRKFSWYNLLEYKLIKTGYDLVMMDKKYYELTIIKFYLFGLIRIKRKATIIVYPIYRDVENYIKEWNKYIENKTELKITYKYNNLI